MELTFAFLADAADLSADGRLHVLGADYDALLCESFPVVIPSVVLVAKLSVAPAELDQRHVARVELSHPNGQRIVLVDDVPMTTSSNRLRPGKPSGSTLILSMGFVHLPEPGDYGVHLLVDGREMKTLPLLLASPESASE
jgi:hypothetical protein